MIRLFQKCSFQLSRTLFVKQTLCKAPQSYFGAQITSNPDPYNKIRLRAEKTGYYLDPNESARRLVKLISLHDAVQNPNQITINSTWEELGLCELSKVEILLEAENEFHIEFADEEAESFQTVKDVVEHVSRSFFAS